MGSLFDFPALCLQYPHFSRYPFYSLFSPPIGYPLLPVIEGQNRNNCAHCETSMKLGTVVDLDPSVKHPMRTHLKTTPKDPTVMTSSYGRKETFAENLIKIYQIKALLMLIKVCLITMFSKCTVEKTQGDLIFHK